MHCDQHKELDLEAAFSANYCNAFNLKVQFEYLVYGGGKEAHCTTLFNDCSDELAISTVSQKNLIIRHCMMAHIVIHMSAVQRWLANLCEL